MNRKINQNIKNKVWANQERTIWHRALGIASAVAMVFTVACLTLPAITMEKQDCGLEAHTHSEICYDENGTLICTLPEHQHTADCGNVQRVQVCKEQEHTHTAACYGPVMVLDCGLEEHTHNESCYDAEGNLICEKQEHTHDDSCYVPDRELICGKEEHTHSEECWEEQKTLICTQEAHTHDESCYDAEGSLVCGKEEHTHGDQCYKTEKVLTCQLEEHTHDDSCWQIRTELKCGLKEHTHTAECYRYEKLPPEHTETTGSTTETTDAATEATVPETTEETVPETTQPLSDWDQKLSEVTLTGSWDKDVVALALSQEGYEANAEEARYLPGFVRFCLRQAEVPNEVLMVNESLGLWAEALDQEGLMENTEIPQVGDLLFADSNGDTIADGVEIVTAVRVEDTPVSFTTVYYAPLKGVETRKRFTDDSDRMGLCSLQKLQKARKQEPIPESCSFTYEDDTLRAEVNITGLTVRLPKNTRLLVQRLPAATLGVEETQPMGLFDMQLLDGDVPVALNPEAQVEVSVKLRDPLFAPEQMEEDQQLQLLTFDWPAGQTPVQETTAGTTTATAAETTAGTTAATTLETREETTAAATLETRVETTAATTVETTAETAAEAAAVEKKPSQPSAFVRSRPSAPQETPETASQPEVPAGPDYQEVEGSLGGVREGVTELKFTTNAISPFGVRLGEKSLQPPAYWKAITSPDQLQDGDLVLITAVGGNYALRYEQVEKQWTLTDDSLDLLPVRGNPGYYRTSSQTPDSNAMWLYSRKNGLSFVGGGESHRLHGDQGQLVISKNDAPVRLVQPGYTMEFYLQIGEQWLAANQIEDPASGTFGLSDQQTNLCLMRAYVGYNGDLTVPTVPAAVSMPGGEFPAMRTLRMQKPKEADIRTGRALPVEPLSHAVNQQYTVEDPDFQGVAEKRLTVDAVSDPATSEIERLFGMNPPAAGQSNLDAQSQDNGKAAADKSVIYGDDNYGAFAAYDQGTFGVTLSALGQVLQYETTRLFEPLDVMFILDTSGSMKDPFEEGSNTTKIEALENALNIACTAIFRTTDEQQQEIKNFNRIGVTVFSGAEKSGTGENEVLLELGHYKPDGKTTITTEDAKGNKKELQVDQYFKPKSEKDIVPTMTKSDGSAVKASRSVEGGTYTQAGIARGADHMIANQDRDLVFTDEITGNQVTIRRKPLIILISDGEPTYCTSDYANVLNATAAGDGRTANAHGIMGYYTVLSANYYKQEVSNAYGRQAKMYSIGVGLGNTENRKYTSTVLHPTGANIEALYKKKDLEGDLKLTLQGTFKETSVKVKHNDYTEASVSYIKDNPYRPPKDGSQPDKYNYADRAYEADNMDALQKNLEGIILENQSAIQMPYQTKSNTPVVLEDPIGQGMELKGAPVIRVGGELFHDDGKPTVKGNTTTYHYTGSIYMSPEIHLPVDLSKVTVKVTKEGDTQTVRMEIPGDVLPVVSPDLKNDRLLTPEPIRLVYQVGMSQKGMDQVNALKPGQKATFYTNQFTGNIPGTNASLQYAAKNDYFINQDDRYKQLAEQKAQNATGTCEGVRTVQKNGNDITMGLGNNGKLTFQKPGKDMELHVVKHWLDAEGKRITDLQNSKITLPKQAVFHVKYTYTEKDTTKTLFVMDGETKKEFILNDANNWHLLLKPEDLGDSAYLDCTYQVEEVVPEDFKADYLRNDGVKTNTQAEPITIRNQYKYGDLILPHTGGMGQETLWRAGLVLTLGALLFMFVQAHKSKEGRRG